ncbi:hypothetical protein [Nocardia salmonicida]
MSEPRNTPAVVTRTAPLSATLAPFLPVVWGCVGLACNLAALALVVGGR